MFRPLCAVLLSVAAAVPAAAQELGASWMRGKGLANALNPRISVIPDFVAQAGPRSGDGGFRLRELEVAIQSEVDTYARVDAFIAFPGAGGFGGHKEVKVEEAFATLTQLPWGLAARGGRFLPNFGRLNMIHQHELDQVDRPLVLENFLGDDGLNSVGAELSASRAAGPALIEATWAVLNDVGAEVEEKHVEICTESAGANCAEKVEVETHQDAQRRRRTRDLAHVAKLRAATDVGDWMVDTGLSGAWHTPRAAEHRKLGALDLTVKWKPQGQGLYRSLLWRSELVHHTRQIRDEADVNTAAGTVTPGYKTERRGFYTYGQYQWAQRWKGGMRFDYAESPTSGPTRQPVRAVSPYVTLNMSEFNRLRAQWQYRTLASRAHENRFFLQWTMVLGPHGAHQF